MTATQDDMVAELQRANAELRRERDAALAQRDSAMAQRTSDYDERTAYQAATIDVLKAMSASPGDAQLVFEVIARRATAFCEADGAMVTLLEDGMLHLRTHIGATQAASAAYEAYFPCPVDDSTTLGRAVLTRAPVHNPDLLADPGYRMKAITSVNSVRSNAAVPILRGGVPIGAIGINWLSVGEFPAAQLELLKTFAEQAVIAITSAETYRALQTRTADLQESLKYQTATSDVLKVISQSTFDLQPVLDTVVETAAQLCDAEMVMINRRDADFCWAAANCGYPPEIWARFMAAGPFRLDPDAVTVGMRTLVEGRVVHVHDVAAVPGYPVEHITLGKQRTTLGVPLLREGEVIGMIGLARQRVEPFTDKQVSLLENFAAQAVIAMENARLLNEIRQRQEELRVTFENMGDGVAMFDETPHLVAWNRKFQEILDVPDAIMEQRLTFEDYIRYLAERGEFGPDAGEQVRRLQAGLGRPAVFERTRPNGRVIEVCQNPIQDGGFVLIYADITERKRNEEALRAARDASEAALRELKTAQANLIQAEKMASLGQLTAGIAHEIKNPLNFVNNFAELSVDLLGELKEAIAPAEAALNSDQRDEVDDVMATLSGNLQKITEHGKRADDIVKAMLEHSRGASGERRTVAINQLIEEALNLAYHGARARDQSFNITLEREFGEGIARIEVNPQDVTRVFLNLFSNGFYAASQRARSGTEAGFNPTLKVTTRAVDDAVEIRVRDNGTGVPADIRDKLFQPFFTTKPTGEGTGLGLSITYDIVTKAHGGSITVDSEVDTFTELVVVLPRRFASGGS